MAPPRDEFFCKKLVKNSNFFINFQKKSPAAGYIYSYKTCILELCGAKKHVFFIAFLHRTQNWTFLGALDTC